MSFFSPSQLASSRKPLPRVPQCGACGLLKLCRTPKMPVSGEGRRKILIVGEAPGETEDEKGIPFVGKAGSKLKEHLQRVGIQLRRDCWITNSLICRPPGNKTPTDKQIGYCRPNLTRTIRELDPEIIIPLGGPAVKSLLVPIWREDVDKGITTWAGWVIPCRTPNAWIVPTFHPSFLLREESPVLERLANEHLQNAASKAGRPWKEIPDDSSKVQRVIDAEDASRLLRKCFNGERPIAFDYETDRLKPDHPDARIVCCSVSDGRNTIAYPWHGVAIETTKRLLKSDVPKIGSNVKFEHRWTLRLMGIEVVNWLCDTMLTAHLLDNRPGITSIKFQAFVRLGVSAWDSHIKEFLRGDGGNGKNQIHKVNLDTLLVYCGLDSLYEWKVAMRQRKELNHAESKT